MANVEDEWVCNYRDGALTLYRGHLSMVVPLEQGNVQIGGQSATQAGATAVRSRGRTIAVRSTEEAEGSISFTSWFNGLTSITKQMVLDFIFGTGMYADDIWSDAVAGDAKLVDAQWDVNTATGPQYIKVFGVKFSADLAEADANTISHSGTIYKPSLTQRA